MKKILVILGLSLMPVLGLVSVPVAIANEKQDFEEFVRAAESLSESMAVLYNLDEPNFKTSVAKITQKMDKEFENIYLRSIVYDNISPKDAFEKAYDEYITFGGEQKVMLQRMRSLDKAIRVELKL